MSLTVNETWAEILKSAGSETEALETFLEDHGAAEVTHVPPGHYVLFVAVGTRIIEIDQRVIGNHWIDWELRVMGELRDLVHHLNEDARPRVLDWLVATFAEATEA